MILQPILHIKGVPNSCFKGLSIESCLEISAWQLNLPMKAVQQYIVTTWFFWNCWQLGMPTLFLMLVWSLEYLRSDFFIFLIRNICSDLTQLSRGHNSQVNNYVTHTSLVLMNFELLILSHAGMLSNSRLLQVYPPVFWVFCFVCIIILCIKTPAHDGIQPLIAAFAPH